MTAELWIHKPCPHGDTDTCYAQTHGSGRYCPGGSMVRLDPEQVVFQATWETRDLTVQDVIDALEEE